MRTAWWTLAVVSALTAGPAARAGETAPQTIAGVTFAAPPGTLYAPARELGEALGLNVGWDQEEQRVLLEGRAVESSHVRGMPDGSRVMALRVLEDWSSTVRWNPEERAATVTREDRQVRVTTGEKRVAINLDAQQMRAWEGERLVLDTRISSGRDGMETPTGQFTAGPLKRKMLISEKYGDAEMPWSVQVKGDIVIHGFPSVPPRAASHGCVRVPLTGANPARWFYHWVETGTPIRIRNGWPSDSGS